MFLRNGDERAGLRLESLFPGPSSVEARRSGSRRVPRILPRAAYKERLAVRLPEEGLHLLEQVETQASRT